MQGVCLFFETLTSNRKWRYFLSFLFQLEGHCFWRLFPPFLRQFKLLKITYGRWKDLVYVKRLKEKNCYIWSVLRISHEAYIPTKSHLGLRSEYKLRWHLAWAAVRCCHCEQFEACYLWVTDSLQVCCLWDDEESHSFSKCDSWLLGIAVPTPKTVAGWGVLRFRTAGHSLPGWSMWGWVFSPETRWCQSFGQESVWTQPWDAGGFHSACETLHCVESYGLCTHLFHVAFLNHAIPLSVSSVPLKVITESRSNVWIFAVSKLYLIPSTVYWEYKKK